jgi:hypothetical protein
LIGFSGAGVIMAALWGWPWAVLGWRFLLTRSTRVFLDWFGFNLTRRIAALLAAGYVIVYGVHLLMPDSEWIKDNSLAFSFCAAASFGVWVCLRGLQGIISAYSSLNRSVIPIETDQ